MIYQTAFPVKTFFVACSWRSGRPPFKKGRSLEIITAKQRLILDGQAESADLYAFLLDQVRISGSREPIAPLEIYYRNALRFFGEERVWSYRERLAPAKAPSHATPFQLGTMLAGIVWFGVGSADANRVLWSRLGVLLIGIATVSRAISFYREKQRPEAKGLIIGPQGLALAQGDAVGKLRWSENHGVRSEIRKTSMSMPAIRLTLAGASIVIFDVFDRPLGRIHEQLDEYLKAEA